MNGKDRLLIGSFKIGKKNSKNKFEKCENHRTSKFDIFHRAVVVVVTKKKYLPIEKENIFFSKIVLLETKTEAKKKFASLSKSCEDCPSIH
jgi:hypothetical protein